MISIPWLVNPGQLWSAGRENAPLRPKAKKKNLMHTPQTFLVYVIFFSHHNTLHWTKSSFKMQGGETLAPNAVKPGKMQKNDASV